jgi:hypothetical protein
MWVVAHCTRVRRLIVKTLIPVLEKRCFISKSEVLLELTLPPLSTTNAPLMPLGEILHSLWEIVIQPLHFKEASLKMVNVPSLVQVCLG